MNYRHVYHAGNFADVHKHVAFTAILLHLRSKEKPFVVIDTHAGRGLYDLAGAEALKTAEAAKGVGRLLGHLPPNAVLGTYLDIVREAGEQKYPGSPIIAARLLRQQDRFVAIEKQPEEFEALRTALARYPNTHAMFGDGYAQLRAFLPPPERRGVILIDPPYEDISETARMAEAVCDGYRRFATGVYVLWYPRKLASKVEGFVGELKAQAPMRLLSLTIDIGPEAGDDGRLSAAGVLVVNPPFGLAEEMQAVSLELLPLLRRGPRASVAVEWIAGS